MKTWSGVIPEGSLYDLGDDVFLSSPCFTFLQMATKLDLVELIAYGCELSGYYAFDQSRPRGMRKREAPLCTREQLSHYLEIARGCRGSALARRAASFIIEGSASPMETLDVLLLCLPYRLGGYGMPHPIMNYEVQLDAHATIVASTQARTCQREIACTTAHSNLFPLDMKMPTVGICPI